MTPLAARTPSRRSFRVLEAGRVSYAEGLVLQQRLAEGLRHGTEPDTLVLLEHDPVITLGRGSRVEHVLLSRETLAARGIDLQECDRGGDVTYHGPGQLVVYPIFDLSPDRRDVRRYVNDLEEVMIRMCADHGLRASRKPGMIGAWLGEDDGCWRKIGAVGVHLCRWITTHGLAFNVAPQMEHYTLIVPCGISAHPVTSLERELDRAPSVEDVAGAVVDHFRTVFDADLE